MSEAKTKQKPKLSTVPRGVWRNAYFSPNGFTKPKDLSRRIDANRVYGKTLFQSPEIAEQKALERLASARLKGLWLQVQYLGPVFFPADGEQ